MEPHFWHERWQNDEIGFHRPKVHPALRAYWGKAAGDRRAPVLVPLCGKSLDLRWLAERGHAVTGVELNGRAVAQFFDEAGLEPQRQPAAALTRWLAGAIEIFEGDFFAWHTDSPFELFYDRAALIALPPDMRRRYLEHLRGQLADDARGLLITFEYDPTEMDGPPFPVYESELRQFAGLRFELLAREDVLATHSNFAERGMSALHECTWLVTV